MISNNPKLVNLATEAVKSARQKARKDPLRPGYHFVPPAHWMNDPNGPIYYQNAYHMFYQHNPFGSEWGNISWGHASSKDLVHWKHLPIALTPTPDSYDKDGIFSGSTVINDGVPTIIYTGVWPEVQCIAHSFDNMFSWRKYEKNPVIGAPPLKNITAFRDPFVWKEESDWFMLVGAGIKNRGGTAFLYRSKNLHDWKYLHPLCHGPGKIWECPNFFPLGQKHILIVSLENGVHYTSGDFIDHNFYPEKWNLLDFGGVKGFYAPHTMLDPTNRRIMWGWIHGGGNPDYPWQGMLTVPRELTLGSEGLLEQRPAKELQTLRNIYYTMTDVVIKSNDILKVPDITSNCLEIIITLGSDSPASYSIGLESVNNEENFNIFYNAEKNQIRIGEQICDLGSNADSPPNIWHIFFDRSVYEIFIDYRHTLTGRFLHDTGNIKNLIVR
ncbi:MAG: glycoside hydrolase family 32 protein, partial [Candidatus Neomarinimicrobiota bacterium]